MRINTLPIKICATFLYYYYHYLYANRVINTNIKGVKITTIDLKKSAHTRTEINKRIFFKLHFRERDSGCKAWLLIFNIFAAF